MGKKRVVGAAENQTVQLSVFQAVEVSAQDHFGFSLVYPAFFHQGDKKRAWLGED